MMDTIRRNKNIAAGALCACLLIAAGLVYGDAGKVFPAARTKVITIGVFSDSYWEVQNGYSYHILEDAIAAFEQKYPDARVEYTSGIMKADYSEWLSEQILSGKTPDLFFVLPEDFNTLVDVGVLKNLSSFIERDASFDEEQFYLAAYQCGQFEGQQYSLPYECAPKLMFMNKSILYREGIEIPAEDWTWEDFYDICRQVTKDTDGNGLADQFGVVGYTWQDAFDSNGIELFSQDGTSCNFTGSNVEAAIAFTADLDSLNSTVIPTTRDFDLGNVAFQPMSFSEHRAYKAYPLSVKKYSGFEWGCIPMPAGPDGDNRSTLDTLLIAMNGETKNSAYAWEFLKLLVCDTRIQSEIFEYSEGVSPLREVTESDETLERLIEDAGDSSTLNQSILGAAVENAVVAPRFRNYDDALAEVDRAVNDIVNGDTKIGTGMLMWDRTINRKLKNRT
ncbi:MAG: extracellular solute-binding protein [Eubacteriales bacterium]|nr:extracellular solute-binding protein [Eubacteriales bacterium]